ncbi:MAG TPA: MBL fold metallo-hydrolase [Vicinamibacterales bacterium]|nr:MBL fold metallo-hydrolase [Vicinamibacterales bacterium]
MYLPILLAAALAGNLNLYFIDVEGGQSTLVVTPSGQTLLVDTGFADPPGRDARRIQAAMKDAGVEKIDYLLITHFHADHIGGFLELQKRVEIGTIIDHDKITGSDAGVVRPFNAFVPVRKKVKQHIVAKLGDKLPLTGVDAVIVSNGGDALKQPLPGAGERNDACGKTKELRAHDVVENPRSTGFKLQFGAFRFLDLGDLTGKPLYALACPNDLVGPVDLYLVPHHGNDDVADATTYAAFKPRVLVVNNGEDKGGGVDFLSAAHAFAGVEDVWQLHKSGLRGAKNFPDDHIANVDESTSHWIKVVAHEDGSFVVTNGRTGESKTYASASSRKATR